MEELVWAAIIRERVLVHVPGAGALDVDPNEDGPGAVYAFGIACLAAFGLLYQFLAMVYRTDSLMTLTVKLIFMMWYHIQVLKDAPTSLPVQNKRSVGRKNCMTPAVYLNRLSAAITIFSGKWKAIHEERGRPPCYGKS
jgi:hypothetical protein